MVTLVQSLWGLTAKSFFFFPHLPLVLHKLELLSLNWPNIFAVLRACQAKIPAPDGCFWGNSYG